MGANTKIEWADHTFNPWMGCTKISPGCAHCYAECSVPVLMRKGGRVGWGDGADRVRTSAQNWRKPLAWDRAAAADGVRRRVFTASLADVFEDRPELDDWRRDLFALIRDTPSLDWLVLTKRPRVMVEWAQSNGWPDNAWAGTTVENQEQAWARVPWLLQVPASVRFLSCEPLLGVLSFRNMDVEHHPAAPALSRIGAYWINPLTGRNNDMGRPCPDVPRVHWVIAGGESGPRARRMEPAWARDLRDQCVDAGAAFHFKQWGAWSADGERVGKAAAGRELDGRTWDEVPR